MVITIIMAAFVQECHFRAATWACHLRCCDMWMTLKLIIMRHPEHRNETMHCLSLLLRARCVQMGEGKDGRDSWLFVRFMIKTRSNKSMTDLEVEQFLCCFKDGIDTTRYRIWTFSSKQTFKIIRWPAETPAVNHPSVLKHTWCLNLRCSGSGRNPQQDEPAPPQAHCWCWARLTDVEELSEFTGLCMQMHWRII